MKNIGVLFLVSALAFATGDNGSAGAWPIGPGTNSPHPSNISSSTASSTSSTTKITTSVSTTPQTNTTTTTTTTTAKPNITTTTTKPNTTTTTTPTTTPKPLTTSTTPNTTTTSKPTPPTPTPKPINPIGTWFFNYTNTNRTCLVLQAELSVELPYKANNTNKTFLVKIPSTAVVTGGSCLDTSESLTLTFNETDSVRFHFNKTKDNKFSVESIVLLLNVTYPGSTNATLVVLSHNSSEFSAPVSSSYKCLKEQTFKLESWSVNKTVDGGLLHVSHLQLQAFRNASNTNFDEALDCASSETPDVVPIAVGCALAALVVIVLVAYLIGRRRSQARGYLSM